MKLKKFEDLLKEGWDDLDDIDWEKEGKPYYGQDDEESFYGQDDDDDDEDDSWKQRDDDEDLGEDDALEHLASLIRQMIRLAGIDNYYVYTKKYDISIQFVLNKKERFSKMMKILGLLKKLSTDTLIQYESELDLWETKNDEPLLTVDFYYDSKKSGTYKKDDVPF
jgi:hypothetical protein